MNLKNVKVSLLAVVVALFLCFSACACVFVNRVRTAVADEETVQTRVVGYLPTWSYGGYKDIDFTALTHVNIAFCNVDAGGNFSSGIPDHDMNAIVEKAHANNVKVMAAIGGGGGCDAYPDLISTEAERTSLNEKIIAYCEEYDLDGVDLDIELDSSNAIWKNYGAWVVELRSICDERDWQLSTATAQWVAYGVSGQTFALFDFLNVMAYDNDYNGSGSHASYEFAVECLDYFHNTKNVPKDKLVLGVPFYGRGYKADGSLDWNSYMSFEELIVADVANFELDNYNGVAYTGAVTMRKKCDLARDYGGIMIWEITLDADGEYSLLAVIKEEMLTVESRQPANSDKPASGEEKDNTLWIVLSVVSAAAVIAVAVTVVMVKRRGSHGN